MTDTARQTRFESSFLAHTSQLLSVLVEVVENLSLEPVVAQPQIGWGRHTLDAFYDAGNPTVPSEQSFLLFCELPDVLGEVASSNVSKLLAFKDEWLEENPIEVASTEAQHLTAAPAVAKVAHSAAVDTNVVWAPDGYLVTIAGQVFDLTSKNKQLRRQMFDRLETMKRGKPWKDFRVSGDSDATVYGLKNGATPITRQRAEHWAKVLGVDIPTLFGLKLDVPVNPVTIPSEATAETEAERSVSANVMARELLRQMFELHPGGLDKSVVRLIVSNDLGGQVTDYRSLLLLELLYRQTDSSSVVAKLLESLTENLALVGDLTIREFLHSVKRP